MGNQMYILFLFFLKLYYFFLIRCILLNILIAIFISNILL